MFGTIQDVTDIRRAEREHWIAETLQRSLLPPGLPAIPGAGLAARYLPATADVRVGGDWYDVIQLPGGRLGLTIGDVAGHGLPAARNDEPAANGRPGLWPGGGFAGPGAGPPARAFFERPPVEDMATLLYLVLDLETGRATFASAGHPPPLLVRSDGAGGVPPRRARSAAGDRPGPWSRGGRGPGRTRLDAAALHRRTGRAAGRAAGRQPGQAPRGGELRRRGPRRVLRPLGRSDARSRRARRRRRTPCRATVAPDRRAAPADDGGVARRARTTPLHDPPVAARARRRARRGVRHPRGLQRGVHQRDPAPVRGPGWRAGRGPRRLRGRGVDRRPGLRVVATAIDQGRGPGPAAHRGAHGHGRGRPRDDRHGGAHASPPGEAGWPRERARPRRGPAGRKRRAGRVPGPPVRRDRPVQRARAVGGHRRGDPERREPGSSSTCPRPATSTAPGSSSCSGWRTPSAAGGGTSR